MASYVVLNVPMIRAILNSPGGDVARDITRRAVQVERAAKSVCPVDTGRLRSSITWELGVDAGLVARIGTDVEYARYVEFGTSKMRAQPYLRPSLAAGAA